MLMYESYDKCLSISKVGRRSHSRSHIQMYATVGKALSQGNTRAKYEKPYLLG